MIEKKLSIRVCNCLASKCATKCYSNQIFHPANRISMKNWLSMQGNSKFKTREWRVKLAEYSDNILKFYSFIWCKRFSLREKNRETVNQKKRNLALKWTHPDQKKKTSHRNANKYHHCKNLRRDFKCSLNKCNEQFKYIIFIR